MKTIQYLNVLNDPDENQKIIQKLPNHLVIRWSRVVDEWIAVDELEEDSHTPRTDGKQTKAKFSSQDKGDFRVRTFATKSEERSGNGVADSSSKKIICAFCKNNHELDLCEEFSQIALSERKKFVQANALCWGCLKWGHVYKECRGRKPCRRCSRRHPTYLHDDSVMNHDRVPDQVNSELSHSNPISHCIEVCHLNNHAEPVSHSLIVPVWLHHEDNLGNKLMVYALLDDQSDACFIKQIALEKLGVSGPEVQLKLSTVLAQEAITSKKISGLVVQGVNESTEISLPHT